MTINKAKIVCAAFGAGILFCAGEALAQTARSPTTPPAALNAPDPALEAARRAFEALPEAERRAIQEALIWTGDFNGVVGGAFGRATRAAIMAFAKRSNLATDGTLDEKGRALLAAAMRTAKSNLAFTSVRDPRTGASLGLPTKILVNRTDTATGSRWSAADNAVTLETTQARESEGNLQALFERLVISTPTRRVTYKFAGPNFFVVSGEQNNNTFYTRVARDETSSAGMLRGYILTYPASAKGNDRVSIAIANAFDPFPRAPTSLAGTGSPVRPVAPSTIALPAPGLPNASAPPTPKPMVVASAVAVSADRLVTSLASCEQPKIGARVARILKQDATNGLMLLEAPGLGAKALPLSSATPAASANVIVLYQSERPTSGAAAPAADAMAASGEWLASPARVLAPLQEQAAGGAVFDRNGGFVGLVAARKSAVRVAGVVPQAAWPLMDAGKLGMFLTANGVTPAPSTANSAIMSAADIAAGARASLFALICTR